MTPSSFRVLCAVCLLALQAASAQASTLTSVPSDTTVTLGDHVVFRAVLDAQPDVKGASLGWTGHGPGMLVFIEFVATALGNTVVECTPADQRDSSNPPTTPSCSTTSIHILGPVPARHTRWAELKSRFR